MQTNVISYRYISFYHNAAPVPNTSKGIVTTYENITTIVYQKNPLKSIGNLWLFSINFFTKSSQNTFNFHTLLQKETI
jgi:hypothetical protein